MFTNPIELKIDDKRINVGDPFVLKHNGSYYLYYSTNHDEIGINCWESKDLVHWQYKGLVTEDPITKNAYAPEVMYYKGKFLLVTSPFGNGHYIFSSDSPLGPFERITDNIGRMIDGSFYLENGQLYLLAADHAGITIHSVDDKFNVTNRVDIDAELNGWTEGPFLIKRDGYYFLTYCGNHLESDGYRVEYSYSKNLFGPYKKGVHNPLLISIKQDYKSLGHSSMILGPDLKTYYNIYHFLHKSGNHFVRDYCIDEIQFNGIIMKQNISNKSQKTPHRPTYEIYPDEIPSNVISLEDIIYGSVIEINYINDLDVSLTNQSDKYRIQVEHQQLVVFKNEIKIFNQKVNTTKNSISNILIEFRDTTQINLNGDLMELNCKMNGNLIVQSSKKSNFGYIAHNVQTGTSIQVVPNQVFSNTYNKENSLHGFNTTTKQFKSNVEGYGTFLLSLHAAVNGPVSGVCKTSSNEYAFKLQENESPYQYNSEIICEIELNGIEELSIDIKSGDIEIAFLNVERLDVYERHIKTKDLLGEETYYLINQNEVNNVFTSNIEVIERNSHSRYGMIVNATNYSSFPFQTQFPINGYFIGFYKNLLVMDRLNYGVKRIYDVPFPSKEKYELKAEIAGNRIDVYIDNKKVISCFDPYIKNTGQFGMYSNESTHLKINKLFAMQKGGFTDV